MDNSTPGRAGRPPGIRTLESGLTSRQAEIVRYMTEYVARQGYPPSMREIGAAVQLASTSSVAHQLGALEHKRVIERDPHRPRAYRVRPSWATELGKRSASEPVQVPLVGRIAAGAPLLADEMIEDVYSMPRQIVGDGDLFALTVSGDSMIDAAICDGDILTVRRQDSADHGDIVAGLLGEEATVKVLHRQDGKVWLMPRNPAYEPIPADDVQILGKVVGVLRVL